jgi:hypothetical protein
MEMARDVTRPRKPQYIIDERLDRLRKFIAMKAPQVIIVGAAELYVQSFKWSLRGWWFDFKMRSMWIPHWVMMIIDSGYRHAEKLDTEQE